MFLTHLKKIKYCKQSITVFRGFVFKVYITEGAQAALSLAKGLCPAPRSLWCDNSV